MLSQLCIRLIHKHFDTKEGEVMVFEKVVVPAYGTVQTMKPAVPAVNHQLHGIHYFVDGEKSLQAYEYASCATPDVTAFQLFLDDFCRVVSERGLQHKFGLKFKGDDELSNVGWTEFEFHRKRGTIMLQDGMPYARR